MRTFGEITFLVSSAAAHAAHRAVHACQGPDALCEPVLRARRLSCVGPFQLWNCFRMKESCWRSAFCRTSTSARAATLTLLLPQREVELEGVNSVMMRPRRLRGGADIFRWKQKTSPCARLRLHAICRRTEMHLMHGSVPSHIHVVCRRTEMHSMHGSVLTNINAGSEVHLMH